ncbi:MULTISPECIES: hypothetical protein [unclassified Bradyrhizobium]|uniref:hypothetical protein n=1 Tax=unclassified Bradyrhizobium TaxID=2631580 RepID=UPI0015CC3F9E|nr:MULTISPECIES: hypothetical protein [unclassified Bradyrhizobium]MBB4259065.1 hypothetical protein [Bradyrhizobium sp. CIR3A]NYG44313.1 hypothetical protein [Bradyrhizobium sp. IAR9]
MPDGVISLLADVLENKKIQPARLRRVLGDFNDSQWEVRAALQQIDLGDLERELAVSLGTARALDELKNGKIKLRNEIQEEVNHYGQEDAKPNKRAIRRLIASIIKLNETIEDLEAALNDRAERSPPKRGPVPMVTRTKKKIKKVKNAKNAKTKKTKKAR